MRTVRRVSCSQERVMDGLALDVGNDTDVVLATIDDAIDAAVSDGQVTRTDRLRLKRTEYAALLAARDEHAADVTALVDRASSGSVCADADSDSWRHMILRHV